MSSNGDSTSFSVLVFWLVLLAGYACLSSIAPLTIIVACLRYSQDGRSRRIQRMAVDIHHRGTRHHCSCSSFEAHYRRLARRSQIPRRPGTSPSPSATIGRPRRGSNGSARQTVCKEDIHRCKDISRVWPHLPYMTSANSAALSCTSGSSTPATQPHSSPQPFLNN